jgi:biotin carboxyl carrier protein
MTSRGTTLLVLAVLASGGCTRGPVVREAGEDAQAPVSSPSRLQQLDGAAFLVLDSADVQRLGLGVAALTARSAAPQVILTGEVIPDSSRASVVRAPMAGRLVELEGTNWPAFGETVRRGQPVGQVSDARPLAVAAGGVVTRVSARPGELVEAGQALLEVTDFTEPLVRVAWPTEAPASPPSRILLSGIDGTGPAVEARLAGPALEADPLTRLPAWLYRATRTWPGAQPGLPVSATVTVAGAAQRGAFVPDAAVVQWDGLLWVFQRRAAGRYARVRLPGDHPVRGGWLVPEDGALAPGDTVVVRGAQVLLSEEFKSRVRVGDEVAE